MDPLSLTASIIAIVGVGGEVAKAVRKLASLKGAPDLILALNNEISDLHLVILAIRDIYLRQKASIIPASNDVVTDNTVVNTLTQANDKVLELKALHQRLSAWTTKSGDLSTLNKASWLREQKNVRKMQEDLRTVRLKLSTTLGMLNSSSLLQLETGMQTLHTKLENMQINQQQIRDQISIRTERAVEEPIAQLVSGQQRMELKLDTTLALRIVRAAESRAPTTTPAIGSRASVPASAICVTTFASHNRCMYSCVCKCHQLSVGRSPHLLNQLFGRLFFGYTGLPYINPPCDSKSCNRKSCSMISIVYLFPLWLLARAFTVIARLSISNGPEITIRFPRIIPNSSKIFNLAGQGKINEIYSLFQQGLASPFDIDGSNGFTALLYAIQYRQVEACAALLNAGADPYHENYYSTNAYDHAWSAIISGGFDTETKEQIKILLPSQDYIERLELTLLHRTVLELNHLDLASLLSSLPMSAINDVDSGGRTPLFWACARGDFTKVSLLIEKGADVNIPSLEGNLAAFAAVFSQNQACIRKIFPLVSGINEKSLQGWTLLQSCCFCGIDADIIDLLISRGADIESTMVEGATALILVAQQNHKQCGEALIAHGANLNTIADNGETALLHAITSNSHEMIQLLLQYHANHCIKTPHSETTLHYAAQHSDLRSLEILSAANLSGLEIQDLAKGRTALEMAERRQDMPPEWLPKFQELVDSVVRSNQNTPRDPTSAPSNADEFVDAVERQD